MSNMAYDVETTDSSESLPRERNIDAILRIQQEAGKASDFRVTYESTDSFRSRVTAFVRNWQLSVDTLSHVVVEQKKLLDYKDLYISLLSGTIDDQEFEKQVESHAVENRDDFPADELSDRIARLFFHTGAAFTAAEISDLFGVTLAAAETGITLARRRRGTLANEERQRRLD